MQVWIGCRSGGPLSTLSCTASVRLRPSGSWIVICAAFGVGRLAHQDRDQQRSPWLGIAMEQLLHRAAIERLAVAGALDAPRRDVLGLCRVWQRAIPATANVASNQRRWVENISRSCCMAA